MIPAMRASRAHVSCKFTQCLRYTRHRQDRDRIRDDGILLAIQDPVAEPVQADGRGSGGGYTIDRGSSVPLRRPAPGTAMPSTTPQATAGLSHERQVF